MSVQGEGYAVAGDGRTRNGFIAPVTARCPKLYVFSHEDFPIYVGQTVQAMAARMRLGFDADGSNGYYGYRWRHALATVRLSIWCLEGVTEEDEVLALESIESEFVFLHRLRHGQWPRFQTEIHFYQSSSEHRALALQAFSAFTELNDHPIARA